MSGTKKGSLHAQTAECESPVDEPFWLDGTILHTSPSFFPPNAPSRISHSFFVISDMSLPSMDFCYVVPPHPSKPISAIVHTLPAQPRPYSAPSAKGDHASLPGLPPIISRLPYIAKPAPICLREPLTAPMQSKPSFLYCQA